MYKLVSSALLILLVCGTVTAQDPQFSQFYAAPLYLDPAFAGATGQARVGANYRNQWPAIDANFNTISAFGDFYNESKNVGFGAIITKDREGLLGLQSTSIGLMASYDLKITGAHITQPDQSLVGSPDRLPMKISGHGGWKFYLSPGVMGQGFYSKPRER